MKANLRKSLDQTIAVERLLKIKFKVLTKILAEEQDLSDELIVLLAEFCNHTTAERNALFAVQQNIVEEMKIFGDEGLEKELEFRLYEQEEEDDEPEEEEDRRNGSS